jgi:hypothetical protein
MKKKIIAIGMISTFLLLAFSSAAIGMKARDLTKSPIIAVDTNPNLICPSFTVETVEFSGLTLFVNVANSMYNIHIPTDETFDIAFYFNDEEDPYYTIEDWSFSIYAPGLWVQLETIVRYQNYRDFDFPKGKFTIKVEIDSNNDIEENNEDDNIAISESITSKVKTFTLLENIFDRFAWSFPRFSCLF